jgi:hypothetical protein
VCKWVGRRIESSQFGLGFRGLNLWVQIGSQSVRGALRNFQELPYKTVETDARDEIHTIHYKRGAAEECIRTHGAFKSLGVYVSNDVELARYNVGSALIFRNSRRMLLVPVTTGHILFF